MRILHIVINPFTNDSRVLKSAKTGLLVADEVHVFAMHEKGLCEYENIEGIHVTRFPLRTRLWSKITLIQIIKYFELYFRMRTTGIKWRPTIVHAHDLNALPIGRTIAKHTGAKLIYDSHELWTGLELYRSYVWPVRMCMNVMEKLLGRSCNDIITVSPGIAEILKKRLHKKTVHVVRNVPEKLITPSKGQLKLRKAFGLSSEKLVILYQGNLPADGRIECLLQAFSGIKDPDVVLVFVGNGVMAEMLKSNIAISLYDGRLYYQPAVPQDELQYYTFDADVGVVPIPDNCMSHHLSLPNKLFEFIQGGLAVVASDLPEISRVINEYNVGQTYEAGNIVAFSERIKTILRSVELLATYRNNSDKAAKVLNWQNEQQILLQIYNS